jgi:hypothetical protein
MPTREELMQMVEAKRRREDLIAQVEAKRAGQAAPSQPKEPNLLQRISSGEPLQKVKAFASDPSAFMSNLRMEADRQKAANPSPEVVQGDVPMMLPGGAIPRLTAAATKLASGQGLGYAAGRTALAYGQGAVMAGMDGKEGESWQDKLDRAMSGANLSGGIQAAVEAVPIVGRLAGAGLKKLAAAGTNISEDLISNYANRTDDVNAIIKQSGGDMTTAADQVRGELSAGIQGKRKSLSGQISKVLETASPEKSHSIQPLIEQLEAAKAKLNPNLKAGAIADIDEMIATLKREAGPGLSAEPTVSASSLYELKQYLGENAKGAYQKNGQIFTRASDAARAAKAGAADARSALKTAAPEISAADAQLSKLHSIESRLNKNLLAPGKPDGALMAAGAGANKRNAATLRELERISGVPVSQRTRDLATAREFANPTLLPTDTTGKAMARMALGAGLGGYFGDGKEGAVIGGAAASPMALKLGINALSIGKGIAGASGLPGLLEFIRKNPGISQGAVQLGASQIRRENEPAAVIDQGETSPQQLLMDEQSKDPMRRRAERARQQRGPAKGK